MKQLWCLLLIFFWLTGCQQPRQSNPASQKINTAPGLKEAPMLAEMVLAGKLPPLEQRLPRHPKVIKPIEKNGTYCDSWNMATVGAGNIGGIHSRCFYTSLVHWSQDWESLEPGIAERWEVSPDGREFTFHLRRGLKFSDGHPFTTRDVAFFMKYIINNPKLTPGQPQWLRQGKVPAKFEALDDYTFRFSFAQPNGVFLMQMAIESHSLFSPRHYFEKLIPPFVSEAVADSVALVNGFSKWNAFFTTVLSSPAQNPNLPVLHPWQRVTPRDQAQNRWVFERNPYFYSTATDGCQLPYFDRVVVANVSDVEQIYLKVISGEVDCQERHIDGERARFLLKNRTRGNYQVNFYSTDWVLGIHPNQTQAGDDVQRELNTNRDFRLALSLAINRQEIDKLLNWGQGEDLMKKAIPPGYEGRPELLEWFEFNPVRANQLLDGLGLVRGSDGNRRRPDGKPLVMIVSIIEFIPIDFLELVREYWQVLGVKLVIKKISYRGWWDFVNAFKFDMATYFVDLPVGSTLILSPSMYFPYGAATYWGGKWGLWAQSQGEAGEKPPPHILKLLEIWEAINLEIDAQRQLELVYQLRYECLKMGLTIYVKTMLPGINVARPNFRNMSRKFFREAWTLRGPGPDFPETYFIEN
jgi:peptide/nickel transport system substrate-binding protein